jgi:predicted 3-demethylubiquinone-9 3-methyltransferase (glyoxalase superfamily)
MEGDDMQKITTVLTFDGRAEEAVDFYTSIFANSRVLSVTRVDAAVPGSEGELMSAAFELAGQEFIALNDGNTHPSKGISLFVECEDQEEADVLWEKLTDGGEAGQCGWLTDRFGIWWQIVPRTLENLLQVQGDAKATRALTALLQMSKIEIGEMQRAYDGAELSLS